MNDKKVDKGVTAQGAKERTIQELKEFESQKGEADSSLQEKLAKFASKLSDLEKKSLNELLRVELDPIADESVNHPDVSVFLRNCQEVR